MNEKSQLARVREADELLERFYAELEARIGAADSPSADGPQPEPSTDPYALWDQALKVLSRVPGGETTAGEMEMELRKALAGHLEKLARPLAELSRSSDPAVRAKALALIELLPPDDGD